MVLLNRAIAIAQVEGPQTGLAALEAIASDKRLAKHPFFAAAQGELYLRLGQRERATNCFERALQIARTTPEKRFFTRKLASCW